MSRNELEKSITSYNRRLMKLRERQSLYGPDTPVHILLEIEDTKQVIDELQNQLETVTVNDVNQMSRAIQSDLIGEINPKELQIRICLEGNLFGWQFSFSVHKS